MIRSDLSNGVTIDHPGDVKLGSFLTLSSPTLSFSVTNNNGQFSGSVTISAGAGSVNAGPLSASISPTGTDSTGILGAYNLSGQSADQGAFQFIAQQFGLGVANLFTANATGVAIAYDPKLGDDQTLIRLDDLSARLIPLGVTGTLTELTITNQGFNLANGSVGFDSINIGGFLTATSPAVTVSGLSYSTNSSLTGTIGVQAGAANLSIGTGLQAGLTSLSGSYDVVTHSFSLAAGRSDLSIPSLLTAGIDNLSIQYDPSDAGEQRLVSIGGLDAKLIGFDTTFAAAPTPPAADLLTVYTDGFDLAPSTETVTNVHIGSFLSIPSLKVTLPGVSYRQGSLRPLTGQIGLEATSASLAVGSALAAALDSATDANGVAHPGLAGYYDIETHAFSLTSAHAGMAISNLLEASVDNLTLGYDPTITGEQRLISIGSLKTRLIGLDTSFTATASAPTDDLLTVYTDGFDLAASTETVTNVHIGTFLNVPSLTVTLPAVSYRAGALAPISGRIGLEAPSATLAVGSALTAELASATDANGVTHPGLSGHYDIETHAFTLSSGRAGLTIPGLLEASVDRLEIAYDPTNSGEQRLIALGSLYAKLSGVDTSFAAAPTPPTTDLLTVYTDGFDLAPSTETVTNVHIGDFLSVSELKVALPAVSYRTGSLAPITGRVGFEAASAALAVGREVTAALKSSTDANGTTRPGLEGYYDIETHAFALNSAEANLAIADLLKASVTELAFSYDPAATGAQRLVRIGTFDAELIPLDDAKVALHDLEIDTDGFTLAGGSVSIAGFTLGGVLSVTDPTVTLSDLSLRVGQGGAEAKLGTIGLSGSASLFPGADAFTASVSNFSGSYDFNTDTLSASADELSMRIGDFLEFDSTHLAFSFGPSFHMTASSVAVSSPRFFGISGSLTELDIDDKGFSVGSVTLGLATAGTPVKVGSVFEFQNFQVTVTDLGFVYASGQASFGPQSKLTVSADSVALNLGSGSAVRASATDIQGAIGLGSDDLGDFTFTAGTVNFGLSQYLQFGGSNVGFNTNPRPGHNISDIGSIGATLTIPNTLTVGGSATNFSIARDGSFVPGHNFGVTLSASADPSKFGWPKWLPIPQIEMLRLEWPDLTADPANFDLDLSASIHAAIPKTNIQLDGYVHDLRINTGLLASSQFPITDLGGIGIEATGTIYGNALSGALDLSLLKLDEDGNIIEPGSDKVPAQRIFYGAIDAGITLAGEAGFEIRLGLSEYGPLEAYVDASVPVVFDPYPPQFAFTDFHAGILFDYELPKITDARQLANNPAFSPESPLTLDQWNDRLAHQVQTQAKLIQVLPTDPLAILEQPFTLQGGASLVMIDTPNTFKATGDIVLSLAGDFHNGSLISTARFLLNGSATFGGTFTVGAKIYGDVAQILQGNATFLMDLEVPAAPNQILTVYGGVDFNNTDSVTVTGGVELTAIDGVDVAVKGKVVLTGAPGEDAMDIALSGEMDVDPLGHLADVGGRIHVQHEAITQKPQIWGAIALRPEQIPGLHDLGVDVQGIAAIRFNSTGLLGDQPVDKTLTVDVPKSDGTTESFTFDLPAESFSLFLDGEVQFSRNGIQYFDLNGILDVSFVVTSTTFVDLPFMDPFLLQPIRIPVHTYNLDVLGTGKLSIGPKAKPYVLFDVNGFLEIDSPNTPLSLPGVVAEFDVTATSGGSLSNKIQANGNLKLDLNTTGHDVHYTVPAGFPNAGATVDIPAAPKFNGQTIGTTDPYLEITGTGELSIVSGYALRGDFGLLLTPTELDAYLKADLIAGPLGNVGNAQGLLKIDATGVAGNLQGTVGASVGGDIVNFGGGFELEVNTTDRDQDLPGFVVDRATGAITKRQTLTVHPGTTQLVIGGNMTIKGMSILGGEFDLTVNQDSLTATLLAGLNAGPLGQLAGATGSLTINPTGIYGNLAVAAGAGIPGTGFDFGGQVELGLNGTPYTRSITGYHVDPMTGAISTGQPISVDPYTALLVIGGNLNIPGAASFAGQFDMALNTTELYAHAVGSLAVGPKNNPYARFGVDQSLEIKSGGLVADVGVSLGSADGLQSLGGALSIGGSARLLLNTSLTDASYTVPAGFANAGHTVIVPAAPPSFPDGTTFTAPIPYVVILAAGDLNIQNAFDLSGNLGLLATPTDLDAYLNGDLSAGPLGTIGHVQGKLTANLTGIVADLRGAVSSGAAGNGFTYSGNFDLNVNTTVSSAGADLHLDGTIAAGGFNLAGSFDLKAASFGLTASLNATTNVFGQDFTVIGNGGIFANDARGRGGLVFDVQLGAANFSDGPATINGDAEMIVNSSPVTRLGIAGNTFRVNLTNTDVRMFGFRATGDVSVGISGGQFRIDVPESAPLSLSFLTFGQLQLSGTLVSNGTFDLTADGNLNLLTADGDWGVSAGGTLYFSNVGIYGHLEGLGRAAGSTLASVEGDLVLQQNHYMIHAQATVLGVTYPAVDFDITIPGNLPPVLPPVISFSGPSVITAAEGSRVFITANVTEQGETMVPFSFQDPNNLFVNVHAPSSARLASNDLPISEATASTPFTFYVDVPSTPGEYLVTVEALANTTHGQSEWISRSLRLVVPPVAPTITGITMTNVNRTVFGTIYEPIYNGDTVMDTQPLYGFGESGGIIGYTPANISLVSGIFGAATLTVTKNGAPFPVADHFQLTTLTDYQRALYPIPLTDSDTDLFKFAPDGPGDYTATLVASHDGISVSQTVTIHVAHQPPIIGQFKYPANSDFGLPFGSPATFSATAFDLLPLTYNWTATTSTGAELSRGTNGSLTFPVGGTDYDVVTLTVTDSLGGADSRIAYVGVILPPAPVITAFDVPANRPEGTPVPLHAAATSTVGLTNAWSIIKDGSPFLTGNGPDLTFSGGTGRYVVTVTVTDAAAGSSTRTGVLNMTSVPPVITSFVVPSAPVPASVDTVTLSASANTPNVPSEPLSYEWEVQKEGGGGVQGTGSSLDVALLGPGNYHVLLTVRDFDSQSTERADFTVMTDYQTRHFTEEPSAVTDFTRYVVPGLALTLSAADLSGAFTDALALPVQTVKILSLPANGILRLGGVNVAAGQEIPQRPGGIGALTYIPNASFSGTDRFTWTASAGNHFARVPATVTLQVHSEVLQAYLTSAPPPPVNSSFYMVTLVSHVNDTIPSSSYTYTWSTSNGFFFDTSGQRVLGLGGSYGPAVIYYHDSGPFSASLTVTNKTTGATTTVDGVTPDRPLSVALTGADEVSPEGTTISLGSQVSDAGPGGSPFTYAWDVSRDGSSVVTGSSDQLSFVPLRGGTYVVTLSVMDSAGKLGTATRTILVPASPPSVGITGATDVPLGSPITLGSSVSGPNAFNESAGYLYDWTVTKNGRPFASASGTAFTFTPSGFGIYLVTLSATDRESVSGTATRVIEQSNPNGATITEISSSSADSVYGQGATFTATVSPAFPSYGTPAGTVSFYDGSTLLDTVTLDGTGRATSRAISGLAAGLHDITASYSGDPYLTYQGSTSASLTHTVEKARLTVTADNRSATYGTLPILTATITGFANGESLGTSGVTGTPDFDAAPPGSHIGTYDIVVRVGTLDAANYSFSQADFVSGSLTITPAPLTIVAADQSTAQDSNLPTLTASYYGLVNGDKKDVVSGLVLATVPDASSPGTFAITATGATASDYAITYVPGALVVYPSPDFSLPVAENYFVSIPAADFDRAMVDPRAPQVPSVRIAALPTNGSLRLAGVPVAVGQDISRGDLIDLTYTPDPRFTGSDRFTWRSSAGSEVIASAAVVTLDVRQDLTPSESFNVTDFTRVSVAGVTLPLAETDFASAFHDTRTLPLEGIRILSLPAGGRLRLAGVDVAVNQDIPRSVLGTLTYVPNAGYTDSDSFTWVGSRGNILSPEPATTSIIIQDEVLSVFANGPWGSIAPFRGAFVLTAAVTDNSPSTNFSYYWTSTTGSISEVPGSGGTAVYYSPYNYDNGAIISLTVTNTLTGKRVTISEQGGVVIPPVAPSVSILGIPRFPVEQGTAVYLSNGLFLPRPLDAARDLTYSWSVTLNGTPVVSSPEPGFAFVPIETGVYAINLAVTDSDGITGTAATSVMLVTQAPPTVAITAWPTAIIKGRPLTLVGEADSVNPADTAAGYTYSWAVQKISIPSYTPSWVAFGSERTITFTPDDANALYQVYLTVTDHVGAVGQTWTPFYAVTPSTSTQITASPATSLFGQAVTFSAKITSPFAVDGTSPGGSVAFYDGDSPLGTALLDASGSAVSRPIESLAVGTHAITAVYSGDSTFAGSTSEAVSETTLNPATSTRVASSAADSVYGQAMTFSATVSSASAGSVAPSGTIAFYDGGDLLDTAPLDASGHATSKAISGLSAGTHRITVVYAGDGTFIGSTSDPFTQVVSKAHLTIRAADRSMVYGGSLPALGESIEGFRNGESLATSGVTGSPEFATVGAGSHVGSYAIIPSAGSLAAANYDFTDQINGTLTITPAPLTITADSKGMVYGGTMPALTFHYTGLVNGDTATKTAVANVSTVAGTSRVGSYAINLSGAEDDDYAITFTAGTLTISPASLTIRVDDKGMVYGGSLPALTATFGGLVNGDTPASITGLALSTVPATSHVGSYVIAANGAVNPDYTISLSAGTLSISPYSLTYQIGSDRQSYGSAVNLTNDLPATISTGVFGEKLAIRYASTGNTNTAQVGTYAITGTPSNSTGLTSDYTVSCVPGVLTVTPAALTVTAAPQSKIYGETLRVGAGSVQFTSSGLQNGESIGSVTLTIANNGEAAAADVGNYAVTPSALVGGTFSASNYSITYMPGVLTVTLAPTAVSVSCPTAIYGTHTFVTVSVSNTATAPTPLGNVVLSVDGGAAIVRPLVNGSAIFDLGVLSYGPHNLGAGYAAQGNFAASAATATASESLGSSVYLLNGTASGALTLSGNAQVQLAGILDVNSNSATAVAASGNARITAGKIQLVGGYTLGSNASFGTSPLVHQESLSDPLAALPALSPVSGNPGYDGGLIARGSINLAGNNSLTINPGIYSQIQVSGNAKLTLNPGIYILAGGGLTVTGNASITGRGVLIYNAGSNYAGGTGTPAFGGLTLNTGGTVDLQPMSSGVYAGILIFQSRDNTRALSFGGGAINAPNGVIYARSAVIAIGGSAKIQATIVANQMTLTGSGVSALEVEGGSEANTAGQLLAGNLAIYVDRASGYFTEDELARIDDAIAALNAIVNSYSVEISEVTDPAEATTILQLADSSALGGVAEGTLGCEFNGYITIVQGWNWYTGTDTSSIGANMYDFETIVMHELGHALGLGHSADGGSVMAATLGAGQVRRELLIQDLAIPDLDATACGLHVTGWSGGKSSRESGASRQSNSTRINGLGHRLGSVAESGSVELFALPPMFATAAGWSEGWMGETRFQVGGARLSGRRDLAERVTLPVVANAAVRAVAGPVRVVVDAPPADNEVDVAHDL